MSKKVSSRRSSKNSVSSNKEEKLDIIENEGITTKLDPISETNNDSDNIRECEITTTTNDKDLKLIANPDKSDNIQMDPLIFEGDETDPELEKLSAGTLSDVELSDKCKQNGSSRSATRRSDYRDIPTPKTPKNDANDEKFTTNNDLKFSQTPQILLQKCDNKSQITENTEYNVNGKENDNLKNVQLNKTDTEMISDLVNLPKNDIIVVDNYEPNENTEKMKNQTENNLPDVVIQNLNDEVGGTNGHNEKEISEVETALYDDCTINSTLNNASLCVNYSENTSAPNFDFSYADNDNDSLNSCSNESSTKDSESNDRDLSYLKTLKVISGRKTLNDLRQTSFRNRMKNSDFLPKIGKVTGQQRSYGLKRKGDDDCFIQDEEELSVKRTKTDGIFSIVSNPVNLIKTKLLGRQPEAISTSNQYATYDSDFQLISSPDEQKRDSNKWCSLQ